jgi:hypothetical protein
VFPAWQNTWELGWVMVSVAVFSLVATGFVVRFLAGTKGLSVEQAAGVFEEQAGAGRALGWHSAARPGTQERWNSPTSRR